ncbi:MAG: VWA domain-containing protein, partial [Gammaproteobacteria bacterium]|nr:VWA domain-containing protein [Gammaproteobacteria bacterium]
MLSQLHFLRPAWLLALIPLLIAIIWLLRRRPGLRRWANIVDAHLAPHVLMGNSVKSSRLPALITAIAGSLAILALAGPAWQQLPQPVFSSQNALVVLLDLSASMNTEDIKPSRIDRARFKVADLLEQRDEGQTALIVYAASSFVVSPLTDDVSTISSQLSALAPELMPSQGSRADIALDRAYELLQQAGRNKGDVLLVTDGVDAKQSRASVQKLVDAGYRISVLGVGTPEGGPVPAADGFLRKRDGAIVVARLERNALRGLATEGGGIYQDLSADNRDINRLTALLENLSTTDASQRDLTADIWREEGPWLVLLILPFAALLFRRGILAAVVLAFMLPVSPADAADIGRLWKTPDQQAAEALAQRDAAKAAELFRNPAWKGAASYRAGDYEGTLEALAELDTT